MKEPFELIMTLARLSFTAVILFASDGDTVTPTYLQNPGTNVRNSVSMIKANTK